MSDALRIGLVAEGWTDRTVLEAGIAALLPGRSFALKLLQPEDPLASGPFSTHRPFGWAGVYRWCRESVERAGQLRTDILFASYDLIILHLDADVADSDYTSAHINDAPAPTDLPCACSVCPPASNTTDPLRSVLLNWAGENSVPPKVVLCTPSKNLEAWVLAALYPEDQSVTGGELECMARPENRLQAKPADERLITSGKKIRERYQSRQADIIHRWSDIRSVCTEADRFSVELLAEAQNDS